VEAANQALTVHLVSKSGGATTGIGRYSAELENRLRSLGIGVQSTKTDNSVPGPLAAVGQRFGYDFNAFFRSFPLRIGSLPGELVHLTNQSLATLLLTQRLPRPVVVTVHDILPYQLRNHPELNVYANRIHRVMDAVAMRGLRYADQLVADSKYTKASLVSQLNIAPERIEVVYLGVDHSRFRPIVETDAVRKRYGLLPDRRYLIYVGSEDPRKNLDTLIRALALARADTNNVELLKVGRAHFEQERDRLVQLAKRLGVAPALHFLNDVPDEDLPALYRLADICVMPSLYEGFGFPVIEAMACGTPVICSNAASLPELAGDAALLFDPGPDSHQHLARSIIRLLENDNTHAALRSEGLKQAARFTWSETTNRMLALYQELGSRVPGVRPAVLERSGQ
jgi:glycosyltransferase involved in cell wall biosynthesis